MRGLSLRPSWLQTILKLQHGFNSKIMQQPIVQVHRTDENDNPAGGATTAIGLAIDWQNGPLSVNGVRLEPNGCFVETVISAAIGRLEHYQASKFKCHENAIAITKLQEALHWLDHRTRAREGRGVEGTHQV